MATFTTQTVTEAGLNAPTYTAAAGGGDVVNNRLGDVILHIKNGSGGNITVTVAAQDTAASNPSFGALTKANASVEITAGGDGFIGPFRPTAFNNSSNQIAITYSGVTTLTVACLKFQNP